jgi:hypothetical protein
VLKLAGLLFLLLTTGAMAQSDDFATVIPSRGILIGTGNSNTFIPDGRIAAGGFTTWSSSDVKNFCARCLCCSEVNQQMLVGALKRAGQNELMGDREILGSAVNVDLRRLPR